MIPLTRYLGGFIRWLLKGCFTNLKDEVEGNIDPTWGGTYDFENYVTGIFTIVIIIGLIILIFFW